MDSKLLQRQSDSTDSEDSKSLSPRMREAQNSQQHSRVMHSQVFERLHPKNQTTSSAKKLGSQSHLNHHQQSNTQQHLYTSLSRQKSADLNRSRSGGRLLSPAGQRSTANFKLPSQSCAREKEELRRSAATLEERAEHYRQRAITLKRKLRAERIVNEELAKQNATIVNFQLTIEQLREQNAILRDNEVRLVQQLQEQHEITRDALNKLYEAREQAIFEKDDLRHLWERHTQLRIEEEKDKWTQELAEIQQLNEELKVKNRQIEKEREAINLKDQLRKQIHMLKDNYREKTEIDRQELQKLQQEQALIAYSTKKQLEAEQLEIKYLRKRRLSEELKRAAGPYENDTERVKRKLQELELRALERERRGAKNTSYREISSQLRELKTDISGIRLNNSRVLSTLSPKKY